MQRRPRTAARSIAVSNQKTTLYWMGLTGLMLAVVMLLCAG
ncbi:hypothetical protein [Granulibacter bethesdensis]|uniref:Uncharacterized protein n=1 Tax=Granulibacter bethesdensis (strain ATCC BAA-1260 / CGDNIH1) TaxID=391165 RepID=Q0BUW3_GRABC|nr:hypothetical protein [Granulibacter bethesdensis]ABI61389.1 Hypothetical protein GbCGDNIH1_0491 [Granulibacter bethesdensis CGDNIH1]AHJ64892.1 Hypothetical protein GbCGDNIH4_0491 [Granulibacter bethesdensis CGDNIH4]AHJ67511.1 Hypothetical protein GbCGDNIH2_0491 [Granulibacter bethesdensis]APH51181.1 Hypothetical protein GbCGDNIH5_0491 [Granulibacter bethesdensis]APH58803.1 Hypothetical protein GbCGDNIH7_0491 [Granulibacter bethesdensis]